MGTYSDLVRKIVEFRDARDWQQFHNPQELATEDNFSFWNILSNSLASYPSFK